MNGLLNVDMHINDLARFIFIENINDVAVAMSLNGIDDTKDLFYFCLDLFCKGLVMMFGNDNRVNVHELTYIDFEKIQKKMKNAGVIVKLEVFEDIQLDDNNDAHNAFINLEYINSLPNDLQLRDYNFIMKTDNSVFTISFDITYSA
jgi:hypothetical protein